MTNDARKSQRRHQKVGDEQPFHHPFGPLGPRDKGPHPTIDVDTGIIYSTRRAVGQIFGPQVGRRTDSPFAYHYVKVVAMEKFRDATPEEIEEFGGMAKVEETTNAAVEKAKAEEAERDRVVEGKGAQDAIDKASAATKPSSTKSSSRSIIPMTKHEKVSFTNIAAEHLALDRLQEDIVEMRADLYKSQEELWVSVAGRLGVPRSTPMLTTPESMIIINPSQEDNKQRRLFRMRYLESNQEHHYSQNSTRLISR